MLVLCIQPLGVVNRARCMVVQLCVDAMPAWCHSCRARLGPKWQGFTLLNVLFDCMTNAQVFRSAASETGVIDRDTFERCFLKVLPASLPFGSLSTVLPRAPCCSACGRCLALALRNWLCAIAASGFFTQPHL